MYTCIHVYMDTYIQTYIPKFHMQTYRHRRRHDHVFGFMCVYVYIYIFIYIHTYIHISVYRADLSLLVLFFDCDFTTKHRHDFTRSRRLQVEHEIIIGVSYIP